MTTLMTRSALEFYSGKPAPPDLAYVISDYKGRRVVTWAEVLGSRRERQQRILDLKRGAHREGWRPYKLWVAYYDMALMGGWQAFIENRDGHEWIDRDRQWLRGAIMRAFPLLLPLDSEDRQWERWKPAFAATHRRRRHDRRPLGVAYVWWDGRDELRLPGQEGAAK